MPLYRCRHPTPSRLPGRTSSRIACPPFDSAVRVGVQPSAQLRHVQRHGQALNVLRALRACPRPTALSRSLPAACACRLRCAVAPRPLTLRRTYPPFDSAGELGPAHLAGVGKLRLAQLSELKPARGVRDRRQSLWRLLEHSPQFACGGLIIYTDVRGEGVRTRLCGQRDNRSRVALSDKCRSTCGNMGMGSELTRRGGGDHEQRPKRVWGAKALTKQHRPQAAQAASPLPRRVRSELYI